MKTQLVIMAAGLGQRFGEGIKQLAKVGPNGEIIIDYSIKYAIEAGFDEVVFVIRKDIDKQFKEIIGNRISEKVNCKYAYQELDMLPSGFKVKDGRVKPYGTGHCILCAKKFIDSPFLVINADDYYGKEGFVKIHDFLVNNNDNSKISMSMAGFMIENTLSDFGTVTRGVCKKDDEDFLISIKETYEIKKYGNIIKGQDENGNELEIEKDSLVSMNMWGLPVSFLDKLEDRFIEFLKENNDNIKSEFLLPIIIDDIIKRNEGTVKVLKTHERWFGLTYSEDREVVINALKNIKDVI